MKNQESAEATKAVIPMWGQRSVLVLTALAFCYGLLSFLIHARWFPIGDLGVESDFYAELVISAQSLVDGHFDVANYPFKGPLYSFVLAALHFVAEPLGFDWYHSGVLLNSLFAAGIIIILFTMLRRLFSSGLAVAATLGTALCTEFFLQAQKASSDLLYMFLFLATVSAVVGGRRSARFLAAGSLAGLAFLTRYSGGVLLAGGLLVIYAVQPVGNFRSRNVSAGSFILGFLMVTAGWFAVNLATTGNFLNHGNLMNVVMEFYSGSRGELIPSSGFSGPGHLVLHDPFYFLNHFLGNIPRHMGQDMAQVMGGWPWVLVATGAAGVLLSFLPWFNRRDYFLSKRPNRDQTAFFTFAVSSLQVRNIVQGEQYYYAQRPMLVLEQAPWVKARAEEMEATTLLARKPHLAHYSGLEPVAYPQQIRSFTEFLEFAMESDADLIAVGQQERGISGETHILNFLHQARGVTRLEESNGLILYHLDRSLGVEAGAAVFTEIRQQIAEAQKAGELHQVFNSRFDLGMGLMSLAQWDAAGVEFQSCLQMAHENPDISDTPDLDYLRVNLSFCYLNLDKPQAGIALLGENLIHLTPVNDSYHTGLRYFVLGRLLMGDDREVEAAGYLQKAVSAYRAAGNENAVNEAMLYLSHLNP